MPVQSRPNIRVYTRSHGFLAVCWGFSPSHYWHFVLDNPFSGWRHAFLSCARPAYGVGDGTDVVWELFCFAPPPFGVCFEIIVFSKEALSDIETLSSLGQLKILLEWIFHTKDSIVNYDMIGFFFNLVYQYYLNKNEKTRDFKNQTVFENLLYLGILFSIGVGTVKPLHKVCMSLLSDLWICYFKG